jgi:two-component system nitrogen regulation response regulator GlnG
VETNLPSLVTGQDGNSTSEFEAALIGWLGQHGRSSGALYHDALAAFEKPLFQHALRETEGNQVRAAQLLGINRNTLRKRLNDLNVVAQDFVRRT